MSSRQPLRLLQPVEHPEDGEELTSPLLLGQRIDHQTGLLLVIDMLGNGFEGGWSVLLWSMTMRNDCPNALIL